MEIRRRATRICEFVDEEAEVTESVMKASTLNISFSLPHFVSIERGDYVEVDGVRFYVNDPLEVSKNSTGEFEYSGVLESSATLLKNTRFLFLDEDSEQLVVYSINSQFDLTATLGEFLSLVVRNMNRNSLDTWHYSLDSDCDNETLKVLTFTDTDCLSALQAVTDEFEYEWSVSGTTITIHKKFETPTGVTLSYPESLLSPVTATYQSGETACNRLFVFGSEKNIPSGYGASRLHMADKREYIEDEEAKDYPREGVKTFDDIYPHRTGHVQRVATRNGTDEDGNKVVYYSIIDRSIPFDVREVRNENTPHIYFNSGALVGKEFEFSYNHAQKKMELKATTDEAGNIIPNELFCPSAGDEYVFLDIDLPEEYITEAEKELTEKAEEYFKENCVDQLSVEVEVSAGWLIRHGRHFHAGDIVRIKDGDLGLDRSIRVTSVTRTLGGEKYGYEEKLTLATFVAKTRLETMQGSVDHANTTIINNIRTTTNTIQTITNEVTNLTEGGLWNMD